MEDVTKERILSAAERLFASKGYDAVTIREITSKARCNLSLVYYYFGSKKNLYLEVFKNRWAQRARELHETFFGAIEKRKPQTLEEIVRILTEIYLERKMDAENIQVHLQLIARELQKPTEALDFIFHEVMKPFFTRLEELVRPFMNPAVLHEDVVLSLFSIFAQIIHFIHSRHVLPKIMERPFDAAMKELLVKHITNLSLHGMNSLMVKQH
ncbi:MAG: CerR family C-terminal domain-containing protein [Thermodesulforhabdaceae bacterium]